MRLGAVGVFCQLSGVGDLGVVVSGPRRKRSTKKKSLESSIIDLVYNVILFGYLSLFTSNESQRGLINNPVQFMIFNYRLVGFVR